MSKRKYNKKSEYWKQFKKKDLNEIIAENQSDNIDWEPILAGNAYYTQNMQASTYNRTGESSSPAKSRTNSRFNSDATCKKY